MQLSNSKRYVLWLVVAASVGVHGLLVAFGAVTFDAHKRLPTLTASLTPASYHYTCWSDAALGLGARMTVCGAPGASPTCSKTVWEDFRFDLLVCNGLGDGVESEPVVFMNADDFEKVEPEKLLDVQPIDEIEAAKLLEEQIEEKREEAEQRISDPKASGQIIEVTAPSVEVAPDKARFLSEYDTSAVKETVARGSTEDMVERPEPRELPVDPDRAPLPEEIEPSGEQDPKMAALEDNPADGMAKDGASLNAELEAARRAMRTQMPQMESIAGGAEGVDRAAPDGIAAKKGTGDLERRAIEGQIGHDGVAGAQGEKRRFPSLRPSESSLARLAGGGSVDKLDGVESGEFTAIKSKKWKYASFFNRMKRQVAQNWHPDRVYLRRDPTGKVYGSKDRITVLEVSLKPDGALAKVVVFKQSGIGFLDDEAVKAFEAAQPFPNPPVALVDQSSQLITFSFGFHFQIGGGSDTWRIFRYQ